VAKPAGINNSAIPYDGRNLLCVRRHQERQQHAQLLEQIAREENGNVADEKTKHIPSPWISAACPFADPEPAAAPSAAPAPKQH
jgi:hypothetical protein